MSSTAMGDERSKQALAVFPPPACREISNGASRPFQPREIMPLSRGGTEGRNSIVTMTLEMFKKRMILRGQDSKNRKIMLLKYKWLFGEAEAKTMIARKVKVFL
jgi:hypothetical protein